MQRADGHQRGELSQTAEVVAMKMGDDNVVDPLKSRDFLRDLLDGLTEFGWQPVIENGNAIALSGPDGTISLEPAGQFELSGAALENLHQTCAEANRHLERGPKPVTGTGNIGVR